MNNNQSNNQSRARRSPSDVTRTARPISQSSGAANVQRTAAPQQRVGSSQRPQQTTSRTTQQIRNGSTPQRIQNSYSFTPSDRKPTRNMTVKRNVTALTPVDERKLARREERRIREEKREREWQKDVVRTKGGVDVLMLAIILLLLALGTVAVFSASYPFALAKGLDSNYFIKQQIMFLGIGAVGMFLAAIFPMKWYRTWFPFFAYIISGLLLIAVLFIGSSEGEATRWIRFGPIGIQPSELMKISMVLMLAWYASKYETKMKELDFKWVSYGWNTGRPFFFILLLGCGLIAIGKHLSGTIIVAGIGFLMLLVAGSKISWLLLTALPTGIVGIVGYLILNPYALKRITTFTDDNANKLDELYQTTQSIYAIGNGGVLGVGLGESVQKHSYLSAAHTDFIFSVWCEEWGFVGALVLILLFLLFMWRGYVIAVRAPDKFTMLTAFGITTHVGMQALLNMMVASDLIMNTGISLPFFSYGGSSLIVLMAEMGILLAISRQSYKKKSDIEHDEMLRRAGMDK